ncbi:MAG: SLBB domain-containing protein [Rhodoferax sp.]|nr:SLBB domain-containing protein [Rhodoferax sp.]
MTFISVAVALALSGNSATAQTTVIAPSTAVAPAATVPSAAPAAARGTAMPGISAGTGPTPGAFDQGGTTRNTAQQASQQTSPQDATKANQQLTPAEQEAANAAKPKKSGNSNDADQLAAESVKQAQADEIEFQRFVTAATGQALRLYGYELFANNFGPVQAAPVPAGYILGPGDELMVQVNGIMDISQRLVIDRDGRVNIPRVGPLTLAGIAFQDAEKALSTHIAKVYKNFELSLTMGRLRSVEVFVVGQARRPGKHLVSSLSSLVNALFETGGPSANGSMRAIELRRAGKTIATVDLYAFLAKGDSLGDARLLEGDIIYIPPAGPRAALLGTLNAPAIYELRGKESIEAILALSGGLPTLAAPQKAQLERLDAKREIPRYVEDFALDDKGLKLPLQAGDILTVFQISPQIANVVTLQGNVASPLRYTHKPGMRVSDLLADKRLLIPGSYWLQINRGATTGNYSRPEVNLDYATVQRLDPLTLRTRVVAFNLQKAIALDKTENLELVSGDIVTVYAPTDPGPETENSISISGEIVGGTRRFVWRPGFAIKDIIPSTQWLVDYYSYWQRPVTKGIANDINWDYAQVIRRVPANLSTQALTFNLGQAVLNGSAADNIKLQPGDRIELFTTTQLAVPLEKRIQMVQVSGEVMVPGRYQLSAGETLPELIKRAGGFSRNAYIYGTVFTRESTRVQQQVNLDRAIRRMEADMSSRAATALQNVSDTANAALLQSDMASQRLLLERLRVLKASGRVVLEADPESPVLPSIALEDGDTIQVPSVPSFVGVFGEVQTENSFIYKPGYSVSDYLAKSGLGREADTDATMVLRADGSVESGGSSFLGWRSGVLGRRLYPGDSVFVPATMDRRSAYTVFMQGAKDWTTLLYQFGIGAAAFKTLKN